jgi:hypothetical protein
MLSVAVLNVDMQNVIMLKVIIWNAIMLIVVMPKCGGAKEKRSKRTLNCFYGKGLFLLIAPLQKIAQFKQKRSLKKPILKAIR